MIRSAFLQTSRVLYEQVARPLMFRTLTAAQAHEYALSLCAYLDERAEPLHILRRAVLPETPVSVGGVKLSSPMILAAGFVKGKGFASEEEALSTVNRGENIIPGWQSVPALVGAVEFGSFTRCPRPGNEGTVLWRNIGSTRSLQNRVGLRNPGARAAAAFLAAHRPQGTFGINIAVSPGVTDIQQETHEVMQGIAFFLEKAVRPSWFTLNLSCPNTEDDPRGNQSEEKAYCLCDVLVKQLDNIPLWVKISPNLSLAQYMALLRAFSDTGVRAVIATNTLPQPSPNNPQVNAGVSGDVLFSSALGAVEALSCEKEVQRYPLDIIGCGGVLDGATCHAYRQLGVLAVQYWSALIYRGPLAAALIVDEAAAISSEVIV